MLAVYMNGLDSMVKELKPWLESLEGTPFTVQNIGVFHSKGSVNDPYDIHTLAIRIDYDERPEGHLYNGGNSLHFRKYVLEQLGFGS